MTSLTIQSKRKLGNALHWWDFIPVGIGLIIASAHVADAPENWLSILVGSYLGSFFGIIIYRGILSETKTDILKSVFLTFVTMSGSLLAINAQLGGSPPLAHASIWTIGLYMGCVMWLTCASADLIRTPAKKNSIPVWVRVLICVPYSVFSVILIIWMFDRKAWIEQQILTLF